MFAVDQVARKLPIHEIAYQRLRDMVLFGEIAPGQAVTIQGLIEQMGLGMTPVREAIRRLTAEGALHSQGNRRIQVPELDEHQLEQLAFLRLSIEPDLAVRAMRRLSPTDINRICEVDGALNAAIARGDVPDYLRQNYRFHMALYDLAEAPLLTNVVRTLWLRFGPSLRVVCGRFGTLNLPDRHAEALAAMRAQDADALASAIRDDVGQGIAQVRLSLTGLTI